MKLVGGDSGRYEREKFVDDVLLAPSERVVVDVLFDKAGRSRSSTARLSRTYTLASITVDEEPAEPSFAEEFESCAATLKWSRSGSGSPPTSTPPPDKTLRSSLRWTWAARRAMPSYACPMHPEIIGPWPAVPEVRDEAPSAADDHLRLPDASGGRRRAGTCPQCGMNLCATGRDARRP